MTEILLTGTLSLNSINQSSIFCRSILVMLCIWLYILCIWKYFIFRHYATVCVLYGHCSDAYYYCIYIERGPQGRIACTLSK